MKKLLGDERREYILKRLKESNEPIKGGVFAEETNVSRQVIVGDITLLKAKNEPIIATSQGYIYIKANGHSEKVIKTIACKHEPEAAEKELELFVKHGVTVKDVIVEHAIYGDLTASIMVSTSADVHAFMQQVKSTNATFLSALTNGVHLHTVEANSNEQIDRALQELEAEGFLYSEG
ncbi:transcription repressor NadR [Mangrovibacillus cuniculi]|uniref:Transcription repressor NadR n=1 Tax=Mangrovibacillus cuniculi TaxID=2593652 RepID=A0A7S8CBN8_9BACI|nr:transcription repressor NadR [Mangrovibacillus cuniculi]QPC47035.1 transcription repressor NadR [Mangrovibacillus cuniculi]